MSMMTETRFEELADAYGADLARWPLEERAGAEALLADSAAARALLDDAKALDATLDLWADPQPSDALMARILGDAAEAGLAPAQEAAGPVVKPARPGLMQRLFGDWGWRPAGAMAACLAIGVVAGLSGTPAPMDGSYGTADAAEETLMDMAFFNEDDDDPFGLEML